MTLDFRCKCNCKFLSKNTKHYVITRSVSLQVFLQLETLSEPETFYDMIGMKEKRTIENQIVQKIKNEPRPKFTGAYKKSV